MAQECWHNFSRKCLDQYRWVVHWVEKTLKTPTAKLDRLVLLVDSLTAQTQDKFKETVCNNNGVVWYGLTDATDMWQPVDAGYGKMLKMLMDQEHNKWLNVKEHADRQRGLQDT